MKRALRIGLAAAALLAGGAGLAQELSEQQAAGGQRQDDLLPQITPAADRHFAAAYKAGEGLFPGPLQLCNSARPAGLKWDLSKMIDRAGPTNAELMRMGKTRAEFLAGGGIERRAPAPTRIFDNVYYVGIEDVTAWAITTSEGIILIDSLNNSREWIDRIEPGMHKVGLDPARIRYVIVTHGHGDHFGGAAYIAKKYGARIMMSAVDWEIAPSMVDKPFFDAPPPRDLSITDGQVFRLGNQSVRMFITPGHTRGTISLIFPVTDRGRRHVALLWGGTGFNFPHTADRFAIYSGSARRMMGLAKAGRADVVLSPHSDFDGAIGRIAKLGQRGPRGPNPFVVGAAGVARYLTVLGECAQAYSAQMRSR
ncbi:MBL fold metallo-hydrolase [Novosphingobium flavum]|uniref:beta-lactamase n=1 Tax=Novosphingobium flavum TaxID=1778672 RepID=A0A7X1KMB5_9SPHN|nr:MBL fold metallo-hydrolase [Novosphingobium flavum]MBC2666461.1 MBL fold metallo-hydrolase [Novosphingobium flavum]